jgi:hypothetical protein
MNSAAKDWLVAGALLFAIWTLLVLLGLAAPEELVQAIKYALSGVIAAHLTLIDPKGPTP